MPVDFFLVTDKIMLEDPHIKRYGTGSLYFAAVQ